MRNLVSPSQVKKKKQDQKVYVHCCEGLIGLTSFYAFSTKGLLKIINNFLDSGATGFYRDGKFFLVTIYTKDELLDLLVSNYKPTFIPAWSRSIFEDGFTEKVEDLKAQYPEYYNEYQSCKNSILEWLKGKNKKPEDIKGDLLIDLFHNLPCIIENKNVLEYIQTAGIPYTLKDKKGRSYKKIWYSPLWNKSLGRFGKGTIFTSYLNALGGITKESWDSAIFGSPHKDVLGEYPLFQFDLKNWGGSREGKVDKNKRNYSLGVGITTGERSLGTAADVLLLIESLTFFRGFLGEEYGYTQEGKSTIKQKPRFSLCVRNTSGAFHTGLMSEMTTSKNEKNLLGVEEIFVPTWSDPLTFQQARERLSQTAELPIQTFLNTSKDLMKHLSLHASQTGIESYLRFACVGRGGTGFSTLHFLIPVEEYYPRRSKRNDIIGPFILLHNDLLFKLSRGDLPYTIKTAADNFVRAVSDFSISRSTLQEVMYSYLDLADAVAITDASHLSGRLSKESFDNFRLPDWWIDKLERGEETAEFRIGKSIAYQKQLCYFDDISELLEGNLNKRLVSAYSRFIALIDDDEQEEVVNDVKCWLPIDFLVNYKFHSYRKYDMSDERLAWSFFFTNDDSFSALAVALDALYSNKLISEYISPFVSTDKELLEQALKIPLSKPNQRRLRGMIK